MDSTEACQHAPPGGWLFGLWPLRRHYGVVRFCSGKTECVASAMTGHRKTHNAVIADVLTETPGERRQCEYLDSNSPGRAP